MGVNIIFNRKYTNEEFFQIIGRVSIVFATMDFFATQIIFRLTSAEEYESLKIGDNTTLGTKLYKMNKINAIDNTYPSVINELRKILPKAIAISKERNRYMHDLWIFKESDICNGEICRVRPRRKNSLNINTSDMDNNVTLKIHDLYSFCDEIIKIQNAMRKIADSIPSVNIDNIKKIGMKSK
jgi:hypothetical protein